MLYHGVTLGGTSLNPGKRHPTLDDGVIVGAGAKILGAITVGRGARIGANAVVVADVPAGTAVVGIPAKPVAPRDRAETGEVPTLRHALRRHPPTRWRARCPACSTR